MTKRKMRYPDKKISEALLEFASPLLEEMPAEAPELYARPALAIASTVWNAVAFADLLNEERHLHEVRRVVSSQPETAAMVEGLVTRKRAFFADDERVISDFKVTAQEGGFNVNATATDPFTIPREPAAS